jgi:hypothetical protein
MSRQFQTRLDRLERRDQDGPCRARVVWLRPDGLPEDPTALDGAGRTIYLPRKSLSSAQWMRDCARRGQRRAEREIQIKCIHAITQATASYARLLEIGEQEQRLTAVEAQLAALGARR